MYADRSAAPICPPITPPTVRMTVFIPVATPVSVGRTDSVISVAIAANEKPTPTPRNGIAARISQGRSWNAASMPLAIAIVTIPIESGHFMLTRRPITPASGPAKSKTTDAGSR